MKHHTRTFLLAIVIILAFSTARYGYVSAVNDQSNRNSTYVSYPWTDCTPSTMYLMNGHGYSSSATNPNHYYVWDGNNNGGGATFSLAQEQTCAYVNAPTRLVVDFSTFMGSITVTSGYVKRFNAVCCAAPDNYTLGNVTISADGTVAWFDIPQNQVTSNTHYRMDLTLKMHMPSETNQCNDSIVAASGNINIRMRAGNTLNDPIVYSRNIWSTLICK